MASTTTRNPGPSDRLLDTAAALFDQEGIRAVGIDRLIAEAGVARASLYQHFGSKDALVVGYLERADRTDRDTYRHAVRALDDRPLERVRMVFELGARSARRRRYRGCLYANALTEFPDPGHPVHAVVVAHRRWLLELLTEALAQAGVADPAALAADVQMLYDGALIGSKADRSTRSIERAGELAGQLARRAAGQPETAEVCSSSAASTSATSTSAIRSGRA